MNHIGLNIEKSRDLGHQSGTLLTNYSVFYQNVRGYHWNIRGKNFFELHLKFQKLYDNLLLKIDEIAERILTLGIAPNHRYSDYLKISEIQKSIEVRNGHAAVENILHSLKVLLIQQRIILEFSSEINDEGTNALMSDYIREQEKMVWMYSAWLSK